VRFPCVHAVATTPAQRLGVSLRSFTQPYQPSPISLSGRPAHCPFRGLLGVHSRYGLYTRAVTVFRDTLPEGFSHFVTSIAAPVASGWSGCRVGLTPTGKRRLSTAHGQSGLVIDRLNPALMTPGNPRTAPSKSACTGPGSARLFLVSRPPALILIAAPFSSRLSRYTPDRVGHCDRRRHAAAAAQHVGHQCQVIGALDHHRRRRPEDAGEFRPGDRQLSAVTIVVSLPKRSQVRLPGVKYGLCAVLS
jgi:hypothetical protein